MAAPIPRVSAETGEQGSRSSQAYRVGRRGRRSARAPHQPAPPLQDPGRDPPAPGAAGPGRQGRARQQGRGADHLSIARRPLLRADAQHVAWRRHQPEDLERGRPQAPEVDHGGHEAAALDGLHRPHRRAPAHQGRDQARLRLSGAPVGRHSRDDAGVVGAGSGLWRQRPAEARDPRHLQPRHRRSDRRRRGRAIARPRSS